MAETDEHFMRAALAEGRRNLGLTAPNPSVGVVIARGGEIIAQAATHPGGRPHAETQALAAAGARARGATLYTTLEPCSHFGQTGPCADAVIASGVARVVSAMVDPDPRVAGAGHARLRAAGIAVEVGLCGEDARRGHRGYLLRATQGRPMVTLKLAQTSDGFAAGAPGEERLAITGPAANARTHAMRAAHDAVMVGIGTVLADDPQLNVRLPEFSARRPLRIVLDRALRTPPGSRLAASAAAHPALLICGPAAAPARAAALAAKGVETLSVGEGPLGLDLADVLRHLGARGLTRIFCEGGPSLAASLIAENLADEIVLFTAASALGRPGLPALNGAARASLAADYVLIESADCGADRLTHYERRA